MRYFNLILTYEESAMVDFIWVGGGEEAAMASTTARWSAHMAYRYHTISITCTLDPTHATPPTLAFSFIFYFKIANTISLSCKKNKIIFKNKVNM